MFNTIKNALKTPDVRKRVFYTLLLIVIFRLGCYIAVPNVDTVALNNIDNGGFSNLIDMISGGAFLRFSILFTGIVFLFGWVPELNATVFKILNKLKS